MAKNKHRGSTLEDFLAQEGVLEEFQAGRSRRSSPGSSSPARAYSEREPPEPIDFVPVPRLRNRRGGWSEQTAARDFIASLQRTGSVSASARAVGMSASTAYRLLDAEGADSFAIAWGQGVRGRELAALRDDALDRAMNGALVPVYRKGRLVRVEHRRNDRAGDRAAEQTRPQHRLASPGRAPAARIQHGAAGARQGAGREAKRREEEAQRVYDEELQRMIEKAKARGGPRVRSL